jgi:uncharacterized membrane protein YeaQ/YmgE (transglycosylase-associated protein family)
MDLGGGIGLLLAIIVILVVGTLAGWLAEQTMEAHGFGLWTNASLGIIGAFIGSFGFRMLRIYTNGLMASIIGATAGAVIVLVIAHWLGRHRAG